MTTREDYEDAARAAGYTWVWGFTDSGGWWHLDPDTARPWDPRHDDGDAFRLAAACGLNMDWDGATVTTYRPGRQESYVTTSGVGADIGTLAKESLFRSAVQIGRAMRKQS